MSYICYIESGLWQVKRSSSFLDFWVDIRTARSGLGRQIRQQWICRSFDTAQFQPSMETPILKISLFQRVGNIS